VLSDGMGHGVKATMLSTLTATMALNLTKEHKDTRKIAETIIKTLPVCSERKISYATFSIVDIDDQLRTTIINFDNPIPILVRNFEILPLKWSEITLENTSQKGREIHSSSFYAQKQDRIILMSDGVTQAGLGKGRYLLGWGAENAHKFVLEAILEKPDCSATKLATKLVNRANAIDLYKPKDDISAGVIYLRQPRKMLISSGPPFDKEKDPDLAGLIKNFDGTKVICGGTTANIVSTRWNVNIKDSLEFEDPELPPVA
ncbi:MAG TPA: stage II sporulation protein E, partial [Bacteroidales bacterium]|nr:stage II sporulation protein E [Bacteroidales bacterium]